MINIDFEFVSTHRNRKQWLNPCSFEVSSSNSGSFTGLHAIDPISDQAPLYVWTLQNYEIDSNTKNKPLKVYHKNNIIVIASPLNTLPKQRNFYRGATFTNLTDRVELDFKSKIESSKFLTQNSDKDYLQLELKDDYPHFSINVASTTMNISIDDIPNTILVPGGSDLPNAYNNKYVYNQTTLEWVKILNYDAELHRLILPNIPSNWNLKKDIFCIRAKLPYASLKVGSDNTTTTLNLNNIKVAVNLGDFVRILSTEETAQITGFDPITKVLTISPPLSKAFPEGEVIEILSQTLDNYKPISSLGTVIGQQESTTYDITLISGTLPNIPIENGLGGYPRDYPFLYVEFYDTHFLSQNHLFSNNHTFKNYFKVTPAFTSSTTNERFTKFTGDFSHKTIRFRHTSIPTSHFKIVWRLPSGEKIKFEEKDTSSPYPPNESIQTSVQFNLKRHN